nr:MAG TPA: hypothetical protein [Bacteriophage sp.]
MNRNNTVFLGILGWCYDCLVFCIHVHSLEHDGTSVTTYSGYRVHFSPNL